MSRLARLLPVVAACALLPACAPANYLYAFDLVDPGAVNFKDFRRPDLLEDADLKLEVRLDPTEFRAVALDVTNKTDASVQVDWARIVVIGPDHLEHALAPQTPLGGVEPTAKLPAVLIPFELPAVGSPAKVYDDTVFELVIPTMVRGAPREYRLHLHATLKKI